MDSNSPADLTHKDSSNKDPVVKVTRSIPWFDDGTVVLQAELKQFRVYRGILSAYSNVFKEMFSLPQSAGRGEVEGCPIVHLDDSADDLGIVLEFLHGFTTSHRYFALQKQLPLTVVASFLRMGNKYDITALRAEAIRRLTADYPSTLGEYNDSSLDSRMIETYSGCTVDAVDLAREFNLLRLLPAAFYQCCRDYTYRQILQGRQRPGGSITILSVEDQETCLLGKETLMASQVHETFRWLEIDAQDGACTAETCISARRKIFQSLWYPEPKCAALFSWKPDWNSQLCEDCAVTCPPRHEAGRAAIWSALPSIFGLPDWQELLKE